MVYADKAGAQYLSICPRGFANEKTVYRVPADKIEAAKALFADYEDDCSGRYCDWLDHYPGQWMHVSWSERPWANRT